jgi:hypothetical protein
MNGDNISYFYFLTAAHSTMCCAGAGAVHVEKKRGSLPWRLPLIAGT